MAPSVAQTARIFEDPEPTRSPRKAHRRIPSVGDVLRGRRKDNFGSDEAELQASLNPQNGPHPLGERHINSPPSPKKVPLKDETVVRPPMHKKTNSATSFRDFILGKDKPSAEATQIENDVHRDAKAIRTKSSTNLSGLLKKKTSRKDLKSNESSLATPIVTAANNPPPSPSKTTTPIWAQFATQPLNSPDGSKQFPNHRFPVNGLEGRPSISSNVQESSTTAVSLNKDHIPLDYDFRPPQRPCLEKRGSRSSIFTENIDENFAPEELNRPKSRDKLGGKPATSRHDSSESAISIGTQNELQYQSPTKTGRGFKVLDVITNLNIKAKNENKGSAQQLLSPQEVDNELEGMLGRYDIPQNLRDHMRNLKPEVKAGLVKGERIGSGSSAGESSRGRSEENERPSSKDDDGKRARSRSRPRSRVFSMSKKTKDGSPSKADSSVRSRSKSRPKSADLSQRPLSAMSNLSSTSLASLATADSTATPGDFIHYLTEVQKPELIEVGKIHKLRILLRNESVQWTDAFVRKGGMVEIVQLLYRIMKIEWREEHEDNLLHETLLCLKALATTQLAMQRLESMQNEFFPALLKMLFDPEKKGPSEFSTRSVIISLIFAHLSSTLYGKPEDHAKRARLILKFMRDPTPDNGKQLPEFVTQMHVSRPYRVWCKEITNVTKEVFWVFLHHLNVVPIVEPNENEANFCYKHFPAPRAPHPAAPYVGGVEWEATQYLAAHLDLLNGLIVSLPTKEERNSLRELLKHSGFEKIMGQSLRTCKEKFYGSVHDGLRAWVAAAQVDNWPIEDVRAGPPRETVSLKKSPSKKKQDPAPQISLDMTPQVGARNDDVWI